MCLKNIIWFLKIKSLKRPWIFLWNKCTNPEYIIIIKIKTVSQHEIYWERPDYCMIHFLDMSALCFANFPFEALIIFNWVRTRLTSLVFSGYSGFIPLHRLICVPRIHCICSSHLYMTLAVKKGCKTPTTNQPTIFNSVQRMFVDECKCFPILRCVFFWLYDSWFIFLLILVKVFFATLIKQKHHKSRSKTLKGWVLIFVEDSFQNTVHIYFSDPHPLTHLCYLGRALAYGGIQKGKLKK